MREVITYVAWDDESFETKEACREYEQKPIAAMRDMVDCYEFYAGSTLLPIMIDEDDIGKTIDDFMMTYDECTYWNIKKIPTKATLDFLHDIVGMPISEWPHRIGRYYYDFDTDSWCRKMAE